MRRANRNAWSSVLIAIASFSLGVIVGQVVLDEDVLANVTAQATSLGGTSYDNPPEPPKPLNPSASDSQIAAYDKQYAEYQVEDRKYRSYWDEYERGYDDGRQRTCNAVSEFLDGNSQRVTKAKLDAYQDALPNETVREQGYAKGFAEGRNYVIDILDHDDATWWDFGIVCQ